MHRPVFLVHIERYSTRKKARQRELEIQSWDHDDKIALIENTTKRQIIASI